MLDEEASSGSESKGLPGWVMTFADLMSLLMCFFVLLLSFSEMDVQKFKQLAGSMKNAFGVQRLVNVKSMPKGTSVIAQEFSPGKPTKTNISRELRQETTDETKRNLDFSDSNSKGKYDTDGRKKGDPKLDAEEIKELMKLLQKIKKLELEDENAKVLKKVLEKVLKKSDEVDLNAKELIALEKLLGKGEQLKGELKEKLKLGEKGIEAVSKIVKAAEEKKLAEEEEKLAEKEKEMEALKEYLEKEFQESVENEVKSINRSLKKDIDEGLIEIEVVEDEVMIRIRERGSFPSGSADIQDNFLPIMNKIGGMLTNIDGKVVVAGHTDNVPISNEQYPSNWVLSAARAANVVHYLTKFSKVYHDRMEIRAHADVSPLASNDTYENRAKNRRVEIIVRFDKERAMESVSAGDNLENIQEKVDLDETKLIDNSAEDADGTIEEDISNADEI